MTTSGTSITALTGTRCVRAVVTGGSAGGMEALRAVLGPLPPDFPLPVLVVNHLHPADAGHFAEHLALALRIPVCEARDKQPIEPPHVYVAPADYHLLVERHGALALSKDPKVHWARPSLDVLFESAARVWADELVCVVLSGANHDGAEGARIVASMGGIVIVQDPASAPHPVMPQAAIDLVGVQAVLAPDAIGEALLDLPRGGTTLPARPRMPAIGRSS